ncbi:hypothetical protein EIZ48_09940 [Photobacterium alginatilyticum]|uniref:Uncharacterized protein n=1 Tax=Photobacterium alginatilyticum TaxID=1775171 RepID=A0ABW9YI02_9GAMM|nr:hypothetical protein [Photobacterium alginatilyticum]
MRWLLLVIAFLLGYTTSAYAVNWRMTLGGHDFIVEQADSHTFGVGIGVLASHATSSNILLSGRINTYFDIDNDELDPDHIPIWFQSDFLVSGKLANLSEQLAMDWFVGLYDRRNTVSSIEKQHKLMPGIDVGLNAKAYEIGVKASAGYYFLEIDDDVPRTRGYERGGLRNETSAGSLQLYAGVGLGSSVDLHVFAQQWHDGDDWLENKLVVTFAYDANHWLKGGWFGDGQLVLDIEHTEYNLAPYDNRLADDPDYLPILPWDNDTFVRVFIDFPLSW